MRYPHDHKARTRERILAEASRAIRARGVETVSVAAVMAAAGLTVGGFYAHFRSKDDLVAQAVTHMFGDGNGDGNERDDGRFLALDETADPETALARFVARYLSMAHRDHPEAGCPIPRLTGDLPHLSPEGRARFEDGTQGLVDALAHLLDRSGRPHPHALAEAALAEAIGALMLARAVRDPVRAEAMLATARGSLRQRLGLDLGPGPAVAEGTSPPS